MPEAPLGPNLKYPWQQAVFEAVAGFRPDCMGDKVVAAEMAICMRLHGTTLKLDELLAVRDALSTLFTLVSLGTNLKYPWQQAVFETVAGFRPDCMGDKIVVAERAICMRLLGATLELDEFLALRHALSTLLILFPDKGIPRRTPNEGSSRH